MSQRQEKISKFLSYVLRHQPEAIGVTLDSEGWIDIDVLILSAAKHGEALDKVLIQQVVADSDKKRFAISEDGSCIRAVQGHSSTQVNLKHNEQPPPEFLYHGTASRFIDAIRQQGLLAGSRHHVHLSANQQTAVAVGQRHGKPVVLKISAGLMHRQGIKFYLADNGVWLTDCVPVEFIIE